MEITDQKINDKLQLIDDLCGYYAFGKQMYEMFADSMAKKPGMEMIVSPANLGDTVFIATLAKAYKQAHGVDKLIICAKKRQADAVEWFEGVDGVVGLEDFEMIGLRYYFTISRK